MRRGSLALCALLLVAGSACTLFSPAAAVVDGNKITTGEVDSAFEEFEKTEGFEQLTLQEDPKALEREFEQFILTRLVRRRVLEPRAEELGVTVSQEEVEERVESIRSTFPSVEEFEAALEGQGLDLEGLREFAYDRILERKLRAKVTEDVQPTEAEIRAYYDEHIDTYTETRASHILLADEGLAQRLSDRLQSAPAARPSRLFASLARRHSIDRQTKAEGGDLGYFPGGTQPPSFESALADMEPDDISDPVLTELGYHVIYVTDRRPQPYEDVREAIEVLIGDPAETKAWTDWVIGAYRDADVKVNPSYGELDLDTQQIVNVTSETAPGTSEERGQVPGEPPLLSPEPSP